jgi:hypothetical protein
VLAHETVAVLSALYLGLAHAGQVAVSVAPYPCKEAATDTNNGCLSEAGGCHTGWTGCGTC